MASLTSRMRRQLTALIAACAILAGAAVVAWAAPIPVAQYTFATQGDVSAFQKALPASKCKKKWRGMEALGVTIGPGTNACVMRTSVVADSSDTAPDQIISALAAFAGGGTPKLQKKAYQGVTLRHSETAGYELRVLPMAGKWQVFRDPKGAGGPTLLASGSGKFIKAGNKANALALRAFDFGGTSTSLTATVNGQTVVSQTDTGMDQPDGRRNGITTGVKGTGPGTGIISAFDDVTVMVPNPF
jgi:hypothetical protein